MKITHYDLFAGIGGFSYALDTVFNKHEIKHIFCEWEAFPTAILKKHWPDATYYGDIANLVADTNMLRERDGLGAVSQTDGEVPERNNNAKLSNLNSKHDFDTNTKQQRLERGEQNKSKGHAGQCRGERGDQAQDFTILTGGFPCQPFSHAGRRKGTADDRYQWPNMFKVIQNVRPDWVIAENVRGLVTWNDGMVLETVCADLESEGYEVQPIVIPACAIGAPHRRDRVWIVAHAHASRLQREGAKQQTDGDRQGGGTHSWQADWREVALTTCHDGVDDGLYKRLHQVIIGSNEINKTSDKETITTASGFTRESLRTLWEHRASATPSSYLYQIGLCDTLPDLSCESRQERWYAQEQTAEEMRNLWREFYSQSHEEQQDVQSKLLDGLRAIERNEAVVIKKDDKGVWDVWLRVYLPTGATNSLHKELCERFGMAKEEIEIISSARHRKERLKACGNAIVPQVAMEIFRAIQTS